MGATEQLGLAPIIASIDNPGDWGPLADQIAAAAGAPTEVTPDLIAGMIGSAVPLLFKADATHDAGLLRGTFADLVIAQCQRNAGSLMGEQPSSARIHLVGAHLVDGHPVVRVHVAIDVRQPDGTPGINSQFWDLQLDAQVTVGQTTCPNCGAPIATGELVCGHCHQDVRSVVDVPLVVSRLELY